jgi:hypothetical protein
MLNEFSIRLECVLYRCNVFTEHIASRGLNVFSIDAMCGLRVLHSMCLCACSGLCIIVHCVGKRWQTYSLVLSCRRQSAACVCVCVSVFVCVCCVRVLCACVVPPVCPVLH